MYSSTLRLKRVLLYCYLWTLIIISAQSNSSDNANIIEAIQICRDKLEVDPYFPKIQHSLAQLLDSQISDSNVDTSLVDEAMTLYFEVGQPSSHIIEERLPPAKVRFESLTRAGTIARDVLRDTDKFIQYYTMAIQIDGVEEASLLFAFELVIPVLINSIDHQFSISSDGTFSGSIMDEQQGLIKQNAFDLCDIVEAKCPTAALVDEYRGVIFRKMKQHELAYQSYVKAMVKSKRQLNDNERNELSRSTSKEYIKIMSNYINSVILVAAAAREAGHDLQQQMRYLHDAEQVAIILMASIDNDDMDEDSQLIVRESIVNLYNNQGIAEKKQGSMKRAQGFFRKALQINPTDGHALVQLASIDEGATSEVKALDADYVGSLFDGYSSRFESELVDVLQYKGHTLVYEALVTALKRLGRSPLTIKKVIDLGCGTGLLGELIANEMPWVELSGVDLSARMVEISRERQSRRGNVYTSVNQEDAATYLSTIKIHSIDAILASDVFIYVGDISNLLAESSKCLGKDGVLGFTVENYYGGPGLKLLKSGRFGHSLSYIKQVVLENGFEVLIWKDCVLRQQGGVDVNGASVILRKMK